MSVSLREKRRQCRLQELAADWSAQHTRVRNSPSSRRARTVTSGCSGWCRCRRGSKLVSPSPASEGNVGHSQARLGDRMLYPMHKHLPSLVLPLAVARDAPHVEDGFDGLGSANLALVLRADADGRAARRTAEKKEFGKVSFERRRRGYTLERTPCQRRLSARSWSVTFAGEREGERTRPVDDDEARRLIPLIEKRGFAADACRRRFVHPRAGVRDLYILASQLRRIWKEPGRRTFTPALRSCGRSSNLAPSPSLQNVASAHA